MQKRLFSRIAGLVAAMAALTSPADSQDFDPKDPVAVREHEKREAMPPTALLAEDSSQRAEGALIGSAPISGYRLPADVETTLIVYRSKDVNGLPTTASAVVAVPLGKAPAGGWPVVIWAHGTTGVSRQCGPSVTKNLGYYSQQLLESGKFALVIVDYAGLSIEGAGHQYMTKTSNALDVINAVPAARSAVKRLSRKWVAIGHSQGGQAVWGVAELEAQRSDPDYLGSLALAPAVGAADLIENVASRDGETFYPVYFARAIKLQFPEFDVGTMLTDKAAAYYDELVTQGCYDLAFAEFSRMPGGTILRAGWRELPAVQKFVAMNRVGVQPVKGPLFIAAGLVDRAVPPELVEADANSQCKAGGGVYYKAYPGDHGTMMESSFRDQMTWIQSRFEGRPAEGNCP